MSVFPDPLSLAAAGSAAFTVLALALFGLDAGRASPHAFRRWGLACLTAAGAFAIDAGVGFAAARDSVYATGWSLLSNLLLGAALIPAARALAEACRHGSSLIRLALTGNLIHVFAATATFWFMTDARWHSIASAAIGAIALGIA